MYNMAAFTPLGSVQSLKFKALKFKISILWNDTLFGTFGQTRKVSLELPHLLTGMSSNTIYIMQLFVYVTNYNLHSGILGL